MTRQVTKSKQEAEYIVSEVEWLLGNGANAFEVSAAVHRSIGTLATMLRTHGRADLTPQFERVLTERKSKERACGKGW